MPAQESQDAQTDALARAFSNRFTWRHPAIAAAAVHFGGYIASQGLRFGSNLILARLLVPDDFGLMLLVNLVLHGLEMFSDLGFGPALIQHRRGGEPLFLRTAWTLGILRGAALWGAAALLAWPLAQIYGEPRLMVLLPVVGASLLLDSFCSAHVIVLERRLEFGRLMLIDLASYAFSVVVMVIGAMYTQTVWPLVVGALVNAGLSSFLTHLLPGGVPMRLVFDRAVAGQLVRFGRWLFISSMLTFVAGQLDRILLGKMMSVSELGVYSIAFMMAQVSISLMHELSRRVLYPVYARAGELGDAHLRGQVRRYRIALLLATAPPLLLLYLIGPELVRFLYDDRYWDAGWMLQVLALGALISAVMTPAESVLVARGDSFRHMLLQGVEATAKLTCIAVGYWLAGTPGLLIGYALSGLLQYPFLAAFIQRQGVWLPGLDLCALGILGGLMGLATLLRDALHLTVYTLP
jgi:O-antigen/teichoic acid export membrane protein